MHPFYSINNYRQWPWLWTPFSPVQTSLFLVCYPGDLIQMTRPLYEHLVKLRVQGLIDDWLNEHPRIETHQLLCRTLYQMEPLQEPPRLEEDWTWQENWAEAMIEFNETFFQKLNLKMERNFPFRLHPPIPAEQLQLQSLYQDTKLNDWLSQLKQEG